MSDRRAALYRAGRIAVGSPPAVALGVRPSFGSAYRAILPTEYFGAQTQQSLSATATDAASLTKVAQKSLTATATDSPSMTRAVSRSMLASSVSVAALRKSVAHAMSASAANSATLARLLTLAKTLTATASNTATLSTIRVLHQTLNATVGDTASLTKAIVKFLAATGGNSSTLLKMLARTLYAPSIFGTSVQQGIKQQSGVTSVAVTTVSDIHTGDLIVVTHATGTTGRLISTIVDPLANIYQVGQSSGSSTVNEQFVARSSGFIAAGSTITVNFTGGTATHGVVIVSCPMDPAATLGILTGTTSAWAATNAAGPITLAAPPAIAALYVLLLGAGTTFGGTPSETGTANLVLANGANVTLPMWVFAGANFGGGSLTGAASWPTNNSGRAMLVAYYGYIPVSVTLSRVIGKLLSATSSSAASLSRVVSKTLNAVVSNAASLLTHLIPSGVTLSAAVGNAATLSTQTLKTLNATATNSATLTKRMIVSLATLVASSVALARQVGKQLFVSGTSTTSLRTATSKTLVATSTSNASLAKLPGKVLTTSVGDVATLTPIKVKLVSLSATVGSSASMLRAIAKSMLAVVTNLPVLLKRALRSMSASAGSTATLSETKVQTVTLSASAGSTATLVRSVFHALTAIAGSSSSLRRVVATVLAALSGSSVDLDVRTGRQMSASAGSSATLRMRQPVTLSGAVGSDASLSKQARITLEASASSQASLSRRVVAIVLQAVVGSIAVLLPFRGQINHAMSTTVTNTATLSMRKFVINPLFVTMLGRRIRNLFRVPVSIAQVATRERYIRRPANPIALVGRRLRVIRMVSGMSQTQPLLPPIDPTVEIENITFDFGDALAPAETVITIVAVNCTVSNNSAQQDAAASTRLIGSPSIVNAPAPPNGSGRPNAAVIQQVGHCIAGVTYVLQAVVITSDGQHLSAWSTLPCQGLA